MPILRTQRLNLIGGLYLLRAEQHDLSLANHANLQVADGPRYRALAGALGVAISPDWPPEHWEPHVLEYMRSLLEADAANERWTAFYIVLRAAEAALHDATPLAATLGAHAPAARAASFAMSDNSEVRLADRGLLVGSVGFASPPDADGTVEIGYTIAARHRGQGIATEACRAIVDYAFRDPTVRRIVAETLPEIVASIRLLERLGFRQDGGADDDGAVRFVRERE